MDNDLMASRLRPPSEPSRPNSAPFIPPPAPAPWEPKPAPWQQSQTDAPLNWVPWDGPAAQVPAHAAPGDSWPHVDLTPPAPHAVETAETPAEPETMVRATADDAPETTGDLALAGDASPVLETRSGRTQSQTAETPWDRPAAAPEQTDAQAGGVPWDAPPLFVMDDEPPFVDDRPADMLDAYDEPVAVPAPAFAVSASTEAPAESIKSPAVEATDPVSAQAAVEAPAAPERASQDVTFDPYDADAPVVPEVARRALRPAWPSWNGHVGGGHEMAPSSASFAAGPSPDAPDPTSLDDLSFGDSQAAAGSIEVEPETPAPWATDWPDVTNPVNAVAEQSAAGHQGDSAAGVDTPAWREPETPTWAQTETPAWAQPESPAWSEPAVPGWAQSDGQQWMPPADAIAPETVTQVVATVPIDAASLANGPMTVIAGPESGLPANLVLRIQLALVDAATSVQSEPREAETVPAFDDDVSSEGTGRSFAAGAAGNDWPAVDAPLASVDAPLALEVADPDARFATEATSEWPTLIEPDSDFESVALPPDSPAGDPLTLETPAASPQFVADGLPPVFSAAADDQWWASPPQQHDDQRISQPQPPSTLVASETPDYQFEPAAPPVDPAAAQAPPALAGTTEGLAAPTVAWPAEATDEDVSAGPPVWEHSAADAASVRQFTPAPLGPADPAPRVGTIEAPHDDRWFLAAEPAQAAAKPAQGVDAEERPRSSLLTLGLTVGMAVVVVVLVLVFLQLMTSVLR